MVLEPEQQRYTATLTLSYADPTRPEDVFLFLPSLRRYQPVSAAARCAPNQGTDSTQEDYRFGFNSNITEAKVDYLGEKKILTMMDYQLPPGRFPDDFDMPLGWPTPSWGKWQLRDVDVISVSKIPSKAAGYCYGKRVMYVDKATYAPLWEDLYDADHEASGGLSDCSCGRWKFRKSAWSPHRARRCGRSGTSSTSIRRSLSTRPLDTVSISMIRRRRNLPI